MCSRMLFLMSILLCAFARPQSDDEFPGDTAMENPDLFEGDILIDEDIEERNAVVEPYRRWPKGRIPYKIDLALRSKEDDIKKAMQEFSDKTCVTWVPKTDEDKYYVNIIYGQGCYSRVGKSIGIQPLSLGPGCHFHGTIVHELGHAVGFYHEHSRSDRDGYIQIYYDNIREGYETEFVKLRPKQNVLLDSFDYDSIMLYGETVFSKNHYLGLKTMTSKDERVKLQDVNDKPGLSKSDVMRINKLYNCTEPRDI